MPSRPATGLLLRLRPLGESDLLVDLFTREMGRLTALAKGGRRSKQRFFGVLLAGHVLRTSLVLGKGGDLWRLESAAVLEPHLGLRQDFHRLLAAGPVLELLLRATAPHDPLPGALELAQLTLARLAAAQEPADMASALVIFLTRLLALLGYGLNLQACLHCGRPATEVAQPRLSLAGGLVCPSCPQGQRDQPVPPGLVKSLRTALELEPAALARLRLAPALLPQALAFLAAFWRDIVGSDLPSLDIAAKMVNSAGAGPRVAGK